MLGGMLLHDLRDNLLILGSLEVNKHVQSLSGTKNTLVDMARLRQLGFVWLKLANTNLGIFFYFREHVIIIIIIAITPVKCIDNSSSLTSLHGKFDLIHVCNCTAGSCTYNRTCLSRTPLKCPHYTKCFQSL